MRYVWFNTKDGTFSRSWGELEHQRMKNDKPHLFDVEKESVWKLIKYECISDESFKFPDGIKIQT